MATVEAAARDFSPTAQEMGEKIVGLTLKEAKELSDYLEEVHGIKPAAGGRDDGRPSDGGAAAAAPAEKTEFDVVVEAYGDGKKIGVIKVVAGGHRPGPERGQGPGRGRARQGQGRPLQGGCREAQERIRRGRRYGLHQVAADQRRTFLLPEDLLDARRTRVLRGQKRLHPFGLWQPPEVRLLPGVRVRWR